MIPPASTPSPAPFRLTRTFHAPRDLVWRAWTERDHLMRWFGPKGITIPVCSLDLRRGGVFHYCMRLPDGGEMWGRWVFREITPPERIVWVNSFSNPQGGLARPPFDEAWPTEMLCVATLSEQGNRTTVTLESTAINATPEETKVFDRNHESMRQGWTGTFDQLETHLATPAVPAKPEPTQDLSAAPDEIVLARTFDAPRDLVWTVWTDPKHVAQWWGPAGFTTRIETMDVRPGGTWKHVMIGPDGVEYPNKSIFNEVTKPERIVYTHGGAGKGKPGANFTASWTFEALGNRTRVTIHMKFPSAEDRQAVVKAYGAIEGGKQTLGRLGEFLAAQAGK
ncbi:MAG TPA: SRPBCC domain-containing protein [Opitutaceae bacterium]